MTRTGPEQPTLQLMLAAEADRMAPARVPEDIWRRGRRRHQRRIAGAAAAVLAAVLALPGMLVLAAGPPPAAGTPPGDAAVPARVYDPLPWQAPVAQSPKGHAAVLLSGSGEGLGGVDAPWTYGSKIAVVGRDGSYRMLRYADTYLQVGQGVRLSPDGRYVVGPGTFEDLVSVRHARGRLSVVDLVTGKARHFEGLPADVPVAWRPDSRALLLWRPPPQPRIEDGVTPPFDGNEAEYGYAGGELWLLDLATGTSRELLDLGVEVFEPINSVAFAPDGGHVAVQLGRKVVLVDTTDGSSRPLAMLASWQRLAGTGAFTPDGRRLAILTLDGCPVDCTNAARNQRKWWIGTVDTTTRRPEPEGGFDPVPGAVVRVAGWQRDGTPVVVAYQDQSDPRYDREPSMDVPAAYRTVSAATLLALRPGGGTTQLVRPEGVEVWDIDVAYDLVVEGRFGGPSPEPGMFPPARWLYWTVLTPVAGLLLLLALVVRWRRRARRWAPPR